MARNTPFIYVDTEGVLATFQMLSDLPEAYGHEVLSKAVRAGGRAVVKEARRRVPKRSGTLHRSLSVKVESRLEWTGYTLRGKAGAIYSKKARSRGAYAPHAHLVEFGTEPHLLVKEGEVVLINGQYRRGPILHPGSRPRPFMRPAREAVRPRMQEIMNAEIRKQGPKILKRLSRPYTKLSKRDRRLLGG